MSNQPRSASPSTQQRRRSSNNNNNTTSSSSNNNTNIHTLKEDELSKRIYYGGCLGLPWLWIVHVLYWYGKQRTAIDALLDTDSQDGTSANDDESIIIRSNQRAWVKRCRNSAIVVIAIWVTWIVIVEVLGPNTFPYSLYVRSPDQGSYTGW